MKYIRMWIPKYKVPFENTFNTMMCEIHLNHNLWVKVNKHSDILTLIECNLVPGKCFKYILKLRLERAIKVYSHDVCGSWVLRLPGEYIRVKYDLNICINICMSQKAYIYICRYPLSPKAVGGGGGIIANCDRLHVCPSASSSVLYELAFPNDISRSTFPFFFLYLAGILG